ncbi:hypothetical protein JTB14_005111 [Gonioctena quinquepunctata]|nr:hypothetical protein JTB14_005111 [Gonioctena quinquepunctata]
MALVYRDNNNQSASVENDQTIECNSVLVQDKGLTTLENDTISKHYINADKQIGEHQVENLVIIIIAKANLDINQPSCFHYSIEGIKIINNVKEV